MVCFHCYCVSPFQRKGPFENSHLANPSESSFLIEHLTPEVTLWQERDEAPFCSFLFLKQQFLLSSSCLNVLPLGKESWSGRKQVSCFRFSVSGKTCSRNAPFSRKEKNKQTNPKPEIQLHILITNGLVLSEHKPQRVNPHLHHLLLKLLGFCPALWNNPQRNWRSTCISAAPELNWSSGPRPGISGKERRRGQRQAHS